LANIELYYKKKAEFENIQLVNNLGINISEPLELGICCNEQRAYSIYTWMEGEDAIDKLPKLDRYKQYQLGVSAGEILKKMHTIHPLMSMQPWEIIYKRKIEKVIGFYDKCGYKIENDKKVIDFIKNNEKYLKCRPTTFQHGDYHLGNMIVTSKGDLGIIDFNRYGYGDPWEEFDRFIFTWKTSVPFANGQIHGYFENNVPDEFFRLMSLYNARNLLASIPWSMGFDVSDLNIAIENAKLVYNEYDGFNAHIPKWYKETYEVYR